MKRIDWWKTKFSFYAFWPELFKHILIENCINWRHSWLNTKIAIEIFKQAKNCSIFDPISVYSLFHRFYYFQTICINCIQLHFFYKLFVKFFFGCNTLFYHHLKTISSCSILWDIKNAILKISTGRLVISSCNISFLWSIYM